MVNDCFKRFVFSLGVLLLIGPFSGAAAQQPRPPALCIQGSSDCNLLLVVAEATGVQPLFTERFESYALGDVWGTLGPWQTDTDGNVTRRIESSDPLRSGGGQYMATTMEKLFDVRHRSELALVGLPSIRDIVQNQSGDELWMDTYMWYGYRVCLDDANEVALNTNQWHQSHSPGGLQPPTTTQIYSGSSGLKIWNNADKDPQFSTAVPNSEGTCKILISRIRWDSRPAERGGNGSIDWWVNTCSAPVWSDTGANQWNLRPYSDFAVLDNRIPYFKIGGYKPNYVFSGSVGSTDALRYDDVVIFDDQATACADVLAAINASN